MPTVRDQNNFGRYCRSADTASCNWLQQFLHRLYIIIDLLWELVPVISEMSKT